MRFHDRAANRQTHTGSLKLRGNAVKDTASENLICEKSIHQLTQTSGVCLQIFRIASSAMLKAKLIEPPFLPALKSPMRCTAVKSDPGRLEEIRWRSPAQSIDDMIETLR